MKASSEDKSSRSGMKPLNIRMKASKPRDEQQIRLIPRRKQLILGKKQPILEKKYLIKLITGKRDEIDEIPEIILKTENKEPQGLRR